MVDVERCLVDGYSTSGSPGTGLGAVRRLAQRFDIDSSAEGTVIVAELRRGERAATSPREAEVAAFAVPKEGQSVNGDAWAWRPTSEGMALLVCDGLGHGLEAATAASRAVESFAQSSWRTPREALEHINDALGATRGAAAAVVVLDRDERRAHFCGLGNTTAAIVADGAMKHLVSHNGILGTPRPRLVEFEYAWPQNATVLLHSDGLSGRWSPSRWPELWSRHPALIAGTLYRDCARGTDDVVVVVAREHGNAA